MKTVSISGSPRVNVGKKDAKSLRREGQVPCVIYGGKEQITFFTEEKHFSKLVYSPDVQQVKIDVAGKNFNAILQDIQFHPVTDRISHIDFLEIVPGKAITLSLPIVTTGTSVGVKEGGKLNVKQRKLKVRGLIEKMPPSISIDISNLAIGDAVRVGDLKYDGLTFLESPNVTVVNVMVTRNVVEETPAAAAAAAPAAAAAAAPAAGAAAPAAGAKKPEAKK